MSPREEPVAVLKVIFDDIPPEIKILFNVSYLFLVLLNILLAVQIFKTILSSVVRVYHYYINEESPLRTERRYYNRAF